MILVRALHGLKSSRAAFRDLLANTLRNLGCVPSKADPYIWMRPAVQSNRFTYYEYVLSYVDDVLCISDQAMITLKGIQVTF